MEITQQPREDRLELRLKGRFDANWADHVASAIESAIRAGQHHIDLDLERVDYLSSAGIRVLLKYFKQLNTVRGALRIIKATDAVLSVLQLSGIATMLVAPQPKAGGGLGGAPLPKAPAAEAQQGRILETRRWERSGATFEAHQLPGGGTLDCQLHGHPEKFSNGQLSSVRCLLFHQTIAGFAQAINTGFQHLEGK